MLWSAWSAFQHVHKASMFDWGQNMGNGANKSIIHDPLSQEIRTWLLLLLVNPWDGDYAVNTTNVHSRSLSLSSKPKITQVIDGRA